MKRIIGILVGCFCFISLFSQDLIVTNEGDSINCKITNVKIDYIHFTFNHKGEIRNTLLPTNAVKSFQIAYYQTAQVPLEKVIFHDNFPHWRFALNGGWSYRTAKAPSGIPADLSAYIADLKWGNHIGGEITYYFEKLYGFGAKYLVSNSSKKFDGSIYYTETDGSKVYGEMSDNMRITYIGPYFSTRFLSKNQKNALYLNVGFGYMGYVNNTVVVDKFKISGSTFGSNLDLGFDIGLSEGFAAGFQISYLSGLLSGYKVTDGITTETIEFEKGEYESLGRFDFSVGLRYIVK